MEIEIKSGQESKSPEEKILVRSETITSKQEFTLKELYSRCDGYKNIYAQKEKELNDVNVHVEGLKVEIKNVCKFLKTEVPKGYK